MKHILKYKLLILILFLAAASSQSKALVISSDKTLVAKNDSLVNMSSAQGIEKAWLEDCRPDSNVVILSWIGSDLPDIINCRIQRWEIKNDPINFKIVNLKIKHEQGKYEYKDTEIDEGVDYRYKVWMILKNGYLISPEVFTVLPPKIVKWGDWQPDSNSTDSVYVNGLNDLVVANKDEESYWQADLLKFEIRIKGNPVESEWQASDQIEFSPKDSIQDLSDGDTCYYRVRGKDNGNISRWSERKMAIFDISPPGDVEFLELTSKMNDHDSLCLVEIKWNESFDNLSGIKFYTIYRKIGNNPGEKFTQIIENIPDSCHQAADTLDSIPGGTTIYYKIGSIDNVDNKREELEIFKIDSTLCLYPPSIEISPDMITYDNKKYEETDIAQINFSNCITNYLVGFEVELNREIDTTIINNQNPVEVKLDRDKLFSVRVKATFYFLNDTLRSLWSNEDRVYRECSPPSCVRDIKVSNDSSQWGEGDSSHWEGNIYLKWEKPSDDAVSYQIFRKGEGDNKFDPVETIDSNKNTITWVDKFGYDEIAESDGDTLLAFDYYTYKIKGRNIFNKPHEFCNGCKIDSAYCKRAPIITEVKSLSGNTIIVVKWEPPPTDTIKYPLSKILFEINCYRNNEEKPFCTFHAPGVTQKSLSLDRGHKYRFEVRGVVIANNGDSLKTAWSLPISIKPNIVIPPVTNVELQPQPTKFNNPKIFVSWKSYWQDENWQESNIDTTMVEFFKIYRFIEPYSLDTTSYTFIRPCTEWIEAGFMDSVNLVSGMMYKYEVIPFQATENGHDGPEGNIPAETLCEIGRIYVPKIDISDTTLYFFNPDSNKFYFDGLGDSLKVKWCWENDNNPKGADSVFVEISDNPKFQEGNFKFVRRDTVCSLDTDWNKQHVIFNSISQSPWYVEALDPLYIQVTAKDKWGNEHRCWSSDWDGVVSVISDTASPDPTTLRKVCIKSVASPDSYKVVANIAWDPPSLDLESGLKYYQIERTDLLSNNSIIDIKIKGNTNCSYIIDLSGLKQSTDFSYRIITEDWVGHLRVGYGAKRWKALTVPDSFEAVFRPSNPNVVYVSWKQVIGADGYYVEWCGEKEKLGSQFLEDNPFYHQITDSCHATINRVNIIDYFFHVSAFEGESYKDNCNESGWTKVVKPKVNTSELENLNISFVETEEHVIPRDYWLGQNYPNPFNLETCFKFGIPQDSHIKIKIFNTIGKEIVTLVNEFRKKGYHVVKWDGKDYMGNAVSSGIYLIILEKNNYCQKIRKCVILK